MNILDKVESAVTAISHGWTSVPKAHAMAMAVLTLRPQLSVEIGVFAGRGLVALGLAHKEIGSGMAIGIDPYSPINSAEGQVKESDREFWSSVDYNSIYRAAEDSIIKLAIQNSCKIERKTSDDFAIPGEIGVLRIDGNHGEQAIRDVERYCPRVQLGGIVFLEDINWSGGAVQRAAARLPFLGFIKLYTIDDGAAYQRVR